MSTTISFFMPEMCASRAPYNRFVAGSFTRKSDYQLWLPDAYSPDRLWPAILFLHGAGERGDDNEAQITVGLGPHLPKLDPPAIVIFPQSPPGSWWKPAVAMRALDGACGEYAIDPDRTSLTGISMGGAGAWTLAAENPGRWSAIAPVCGWMATIRPMPDVPIRIFHGDADPVVDVEYSRRMAAHLGSRAVYTELAGVNHNSWDPAYRDSDLVAWLVEQRRR
jgi:predicted peptidase